MRTIKFRGKCIDTNKWVYGYLVKFEGTHLGIKISIGNEVTYITDGISYWQVVPNTIGQFIGEFDKNNKEVYEGDKVRWENESRTTEGILEYNSGTFELVEKDNSSSLVTWRMELNRWEVIGNKYD